MADDFSQIVWFREKPLGPSLENRLPFLSKVTGNHSQTQTPSSRNSLNPSFYFIKLFAKTPNSSRYIDPGPGRHQKISQQCQSDGQFHRRPLCSVKLNSNKEDSICINHSQVVPQPIILVTIELFNNYFKLTH